MRISTKNRGYRKEPVKAEEYLKWKNTLEGIKSPLSDTDWRMHKQSERIMKSPNQNVKKKMYLKMGIV